MLVHRFQSTPNYCSVKIRAKAHKFHPQNFKIMTATFQTSAFSTLETSTRNNRRSNRRMPRLFQVDVEDFDNEVRSYEIEAYNACEAAEKAESLFPGDVYNMNIYDLGF